MLIIVDIFGKLKCSESSPRVRATPPRTRGAQEWLGYTPLTSRPDRFLSLRITHPAAFRWGRGTKKASRQTSELPDVGRSALALKSGIPSSGIPSIPCVTPARFGDDFRQPQARIEVFVADPEDPPVLTRSNQMRPLVPTFSAKRGLTRSFSLLLPP